MSEVNVTDQAGVRFIALDRPESRNGLTEAVCASLAAAFDGAGASADLRCVVLTGKGGAFCSGADLRGNAAALSDPANREEHVRKYFHGLIRAVRRIEKPVLALVDGAAVGFGCDLALACDMRIGTERTRFGEVFVKRALMPDGGGTWSLPRLIGLGRAFDMMFTGELIGSDMAAALGLVSRVFASAEAEAATWALAKRLAAGPPLALAAIKRAVYAAQTSTLDQALDVELHNQLKLLTSKDFLEGVTSFFEKRDPKFTGE
jgi:enoyl-CoA hydratase/carnithine racemase